MKKFLVLLMVCGLAGFANANANLLVNGDFEQGAGVGWSPWWGGNTGIGDHTADYGENPPENIDAGIWWPDDGWVQVVGSLGEGVYQFGGQAINASAYPLNGRKALIKAEMGDGVNLWWAQETYIDDTAPINVWTNTAGDDIITIGPDGVPVVKIVLLMWGMDDNQFSGSGNGYFDNVYLTPEPATIAMLGIGGILLLRRRK